MIRLHDSDIIAHGINVSLGKQSVRAVGFWRFDVVYASCGMRDEQTLLSVLKHLQIAFVLPTAGVFTCNG